MDINKQTNERTRRSSGSRRRKEMGWENAREPALSRCIWRERCGDGRHISRERGKAQRERERERALATSPPTTTTRTPPRHHAPGLLCGTSPNGDWLAGGGDKDCTLAGEADEAVSEGPNGEGGCGCGWGWAWWRCWTGAGWNWRWWRWWCCCEGWRCVATWWCAYEYCECDTA